jgi:hypothetical protein
MNGIFRISVTQAELLLLELIRDEKNQFFDIFCFVTKKPNKLFCLLYEKQRKS